jgi:hypothetical protein
MVRKHSSTFYDSCQSRSRSGQVFGAPSSLTSLCTRVRVTYRTTTKIEALCLKTRRVRYLSIWRNVKNLVAAQKHHRISFFHKLQLRTTGGKNKKFTCGSTIKLFDYTVRRADAEFLLTACGSACTTQFYQNQNSSRAFLPESLIEREAPGRPAVLAAAANSS